MSYETFRQKLPECPFYVKGIGLCAVDRQPKGTRPCEIFGGNCSILAGYKPKSRELAIRSTQNMREILEARTRPQELSAQVQ